MAAYAVVGHVEWMEFLRVARLPQPGEIIHAHESWQVPGGGGAVAAVQLLRLAGEVLFFTALGDDETGERALQELQAMGVTVHAARRPTPQRRGVCFVDDQGERTIIVIGERLGAAGTDALPWDLLQKCQGVYFTAGDDGALAQARRARALVSTSRVLPALLRTLTPLDGLVGSGHDASESFVPDEIRPIPGLMVLTEGGEGGRFWTRGGAAQRYPAVPLPGPVQDAYGCGDSFAAALAYGLGEGLSPLETLAVAARVGATCLTGKGPYGRQLTGAEL